MYRGRTTLSKFLIERLRESDPAGDLAALLVDLAAAVKAIAAMTAKGALVGAIDGPESTGDAGFRLDRLAHDAIVGHCEWGGQLSGMASAMQEEPCRMAPASQRGPYLLLFDPLHGAADLDVDMPVGTIFSVLRHDGGSPPAAADFMRQGTALVAAGYAIYGPATMLVLTCGRGSHGFTLDREIGNFVLTHPDLAIAADTREFAIDSSGERFWTPPIERYVAECKAGVTGVRGHDFSMRWIASAVAAVHRILVRGGVLIYPIDAKDSPRTGALRLAFEAHPLGFIVEQAGGLASTGRACVLGIRPEALDARGPAILGSRNEVERIDRYHREHDRGTDRPYASPLFNDRSLFRPEALS